MIGFFKERSTFHIPVLMLMALVLKISFITNPLPAEPPTAGGLLDEWLYNSVWQNLNPVMVSAITLFILFFSALYANYLLTAKRMFQRTHMLVAVSIILFTSLFAGMQRLQAGIILLPVTILLYQQMIRLYHTPEPKTVVVNLGLLTGSAYLLYHPYWWMIPCCFWALAQMRPFKLNEWFLLLLSLLTPAYFLLSYEYITDQWAPMRHWPVWNPIRQWPEVNRWWTIGIVIGLVWVIAGIASWQLTSRRMLIQMRKSWYLLFVMGFLIMPSMFFPKGNVYEGLAILSFPASAIAANAFAGEKKHLGSLVLFWVVLVTGAIISWAVINGRL